MNNTTYVHQNHAGQGVGRVLMAQALGDMRSAGYIKASLWVLETNQPSRSFYEHLGWQVDGQTKDNVRDNITLREIRYGTDL